MLSERWGFVPSHQNQIQCAVTSSIYRIPDEHPAKSDRLPLRSIIHQESYSDYTPEKIDDFYAEKESLEENKEFVRINNVETLAQVFTDIRYTKKDCEAMSIGFMDALKQQGFVK